jgi:hypothetical protein
MRTAILIIGHIRTWTDCIDNFKESFEHLNPDIFVSTYDLQYNYHPTQNGWMGGASDSHLTYDEIISLFKNINLVQLDLENIQDVLNQYELIKPKLNSNFQNEVNTYLQYRKIQRAVDILKKVEDKNSYKYDNIIKIRTDVHHNKFEYEICENSVLISDGNVFPNDVIFAMKRDKFLDISEFFISECYNPIYTDSHLKSPHNLLLRGFEHVGVEIQQKNLMDCVIRKTGKHYYHNIK